MSKFMYLYRGPAPTSEPTTVQAAERIAAFGAWMDMVGTALIDVGCPFGTGTSVRDDGSNGAAADLIGYSIVEADSLVEAQRLTAGLPFLSSGDGRHAVDIFELLPM